MPTVCNLSKILLIEDSDDDAFLFRRLIARQGIECDITRLSDGLAAIRFLEQLAGDASFADEQRPDLIFLDLKMPGFTGFEVLAWVAAQQFDPPLNIAVLSGSEHTGDIQKVNALGAPFCFAKPLRAEQLHAFIAASGFPRPSALASC